VSPPCEEKVEVEVEVETKRRVYPQISQINTDGSDEERRRRIMDCRPWTMDPGREREERGTKN